MTAVKDTIETPPAAPTIRKRFSLRKLSIALPLLLAAIIGPLLVASNDARPLGAAFIGSVIGALIVGRYWPHRTNTES